MLASQLTGWALLLALGQAPDAATRPKLARALEVPGTIEVVQVSGLQEALGVPLRLHAVRSKERPEALHRHFLRAFAAAGLFIPDDSELVDMGPLMQVTGLDVDSGTSYSVLLQPNLDGTTTVVVGRAFLHARGALEAQEELPIFPGGKGPIRSRTEGSRTLSYEVPGATPQEVLDFHREVLGSAGLRQAAPGLFVGPDRQLTVRVTPQGSGGLSVLVVESLTIGGHSTDE